MARARLVTGRSLTLYEHEYKPKAFKSDRPGRCFICTLEYPEGETVVWGEKSFKGSKRFVPVHLLCKEWEHKARHNEPTEDRGFDVMPATSTRLENKKIAARNRKIDKQSVFNRS